MFSIDNKGWLVSNSQVIARRVTPNVSGNITPEGIVIHYTASVNAKGSVEWLCNPDARASAHLVIDQQGGVTQLAPFTTATWHAGQSSHLGRKGCNSFTIGIELANAGMLAPKSDGTFVDGNKKVHATAFVGKSRNPSNPCTVWDDYTEDQIAVNQEICMALVKRYGLKFVVGHEEISPGRKSDPGPAFPMNKLENYLFGTRR